ncbi:MAG: hypothetical protein SVN78_03500 [Deferribacterota bacterium]|nr:hypothetical protein [Deferribacterota bacterium]
MKRNIFIYAILLLFPLYVSSAEFAADVIEINNGYISKKGKIYVKDNKRRIEFNDSVEKVITILDLNKDKGYILDPKNKAYVTIYNIKSLIGEDKIYNNKNAKNIGTEIIDNLKCKILQVNEKDNIIYKYWYAELINFPLKIIVSTENKEVFHREFKNINMRKIDSSLFSVPRDYKKVN